MFSDYDYNNRYAYTHSSKYRVGKSSKANQIVASIGILDAYQRNQYYEHVVCRFCFLKEKFGRNIPGNFPYVTITSAVTIISFYFYFLFMAIDTSFRTDRSYLTEFANLIQNSELVFYGELLILFNKTERYILENIHSEMTSETEIRIELFEKCLHASIFGATLRTV